jgi:hypothetical protein
VLGLCQHCQQCQLSSRLPHVSGPRLAYNRFVWNLPVAPTRLCKFRILLTVQVSTLLKAEGGERNNKVLRRYMESAHCVRSCCASSLGAKRNTRFQFAPAKGFGFVCRKLAAIAPSCISTVACHSCWPAHPLPGATDWVQPWSPSGSTHDFRRSLRTPFRQRVAHKAHHVGEHINRALRTELHATKAPRTAIRCCNTNEGGRRESRLGTQASAKYGPLRNSL